MLYTETPNNMSLPIDFSSLADAFAALPSAPRLSREFGVGWNPHSEDVPSLGNTSTHSLRRRIRSAQTAKSPDSLPTLINRESLTNESTGDSWRSHSSNSLSSVSHIPHHKPAPQEQLHEEPTDCKYKSKYISKSSPYSLSSAIPFTYSFVSSTTPNSPRHARSRSVPLLSSADRALCVPSTVESIPAGIDRKMASRWDKLANAAMVSIHSHDNESKATSSTDNK